MTCHFEAPITVVRDPVGCQIPHGFHVCRNEQGWDGGGVFLGPNSTVQGEMAYQIRRVQCRVISGTVGSKAMPEEKGIGEPKTEGAGGRDQRKVITNTLGRIRGTSGEAGVTGTVWARGAGACAQQARLQQEDRERAECWVSQGDPGVVSAAIEGRRRQQREGVGEIDACGPMAM